MRPGSKRRFCFETPDPIRLSSRAKKPLEGKKPPPGHTLRIEPGCFLEVILESARFTWPVPLPAEHEIGTEAESGPGQGNRKPSKR
jgi:hypothetical protein